MGTPTSRRGFLRMGAGVAGAAGAVAAGAATFGRISSANAQATVMGWPQLETSDTEAYGVRSSFDKSGRISQLYGLRPAEMAGGAPLLYTPLQDQTGIITPSGLTFTVFHGMRPAEEIDPREHNLMIHGLVDRPLMFNVDELKRLPTVSRIYFNECNSNSRPALWGWDKMPTVQHSHGLLSCTEWTGVPLRVLLDMAGVKKNGRWLFVESAHEGKHSKSVPLSKAMDDALVAFGQNGEALRPEQGFPLRLVCPGFEGLFQVKVLRRIKVVDEPYMANFETTHYVDRRADGKVRWFRFEMPPKSVITRPSGGQHMLGKGFHQIVGFAWSGGGKVARVEVSTNGGRTWNDATVQGPVLPHALTRFTYDWNWNGDEATIMSRCTDDIGQVQPTLAELNAYHRVDMSMWKDPAQSGYAHFNAIQPWKILRDGEVHNALF